MPVRKELPNLTFVLLIIIELYTANVIIFKTILSSESYNLLSCCSGPPRYIVSIIISYILAGRDIWRYYILIDNFLILGILSVTSYYFLILSGEGKTVLDVLAWLNFLIIVFLYSGHFRIIMKLAEWSSKRVIFYKLVKVYSTLLYTGLGIANTVGGELGDLKDVYLLFVITNSVYLCEFVFYMTGRDGSEDGEWTYEIKDEEAQSDRVNNTELTGVELTAP